MGNCNSSKQPSLSPNHKQDRSRSRSGSQDLESKKVIPVNATKEAKCTIPGYKAVEDLRHTAAHANIIIFTYNELRLATKYFRPDKVIGRGGFGTVYKGLIDDNVRAGFKHTRVAVKMLNHEGTQGDREWLAEVNYLGQFDHPNLVKLIGYCCEEEHRLLVYEYMASGCLEKHLFRGARFPMPWSTRLKVALDAAKGLAFLHGEQRPIIYRDFKTSNILLDKDYKAKLSDFGLAKEGPIGDQTHVTTRVMGTYGYAAPEYVMTGHLTSRSDVYGYGVVLLEMLMGRRAIEKSKSGRECNIVELTRPLLVRSRKLLKIIDTKMEGQYTIRILQKVAKLAYQCLSQNPRERPTMSQIVATLESLQSLPECRTEWIVQNGEKAITLYEAPKGKHGNAATKEKRCQEDAKKMQRNLTALYGRSRSEPAIESNYEQTYHLCVDDETRQCGSFTIRNGRENIF